MSKKHFKNAAEEIRMYVVAGQLDIARACAKLICEINDSPYFDIDFFYEACGLERR